jgi:hypothetical protein
MAQREAGDILPMPGGGELNGIAGPRSASRLIAATFGLYRLYPWLFLLLAAGVIVPYQLILLALGLSGAHARGSFGLGMILAATDWALINGLVSALHVHAVADVREGRRPEIVAVARRGVRVLPVVAAATIMSWLGITVGFFLLLVPGVILLFRWAVVAQSAAIEHQGWLPALRRSGELAEGRYRHIFVCFVYVGLITITPALLISFGLDHDALGARPFLVDLVIDILTSSFSALALALLYYDLVAREELELMPAGGDATGPESGPTDQLGDSEDTYGGRPKGWYIDPDDPSRMRFWDAAGDPPGWKGTPGKLRRAWKKGQQRDRDTE